MQNMEQTADEITFVMSTLTVTASGVTTPYDYDAENGTISYTDENTGITTVMEMI